MTLCDHSASQSFVNTKYITKNRQQAITMYYIFYFCRIPALVSPLEPIGLTSGWRQKLGIGTAIPRMVLSPPNSKASPLKVVILSERVRMSSLMWMNPYPELMNPPCRFTKTWSQCKYVWDAYFFNYFPEFSPCSIVLLLHSLFFLLGII